MLHRLFALIALVVLSAAGCNTVEGFGRDTKAAGEAIEDTAEEVKEDL